MGSSGLPVRRLQSRMSAVGFEVGGVDGRFGAKTEQAGQQLQQQAALGAGGVGGGGADGRFGAKPEQAVKQLQQQAELGADGVVGAKTWAIVDALENEGPA